MPEIWKKFNLEVMTIFFLKIGKMHKFWSPESRDFWSLGTYKQLEEYIKCVSCALRIKLFLNFLSRQ